MSLHPTAVEIIDHVLGGIAPGLPCVLAGPSGSGRTVLCIQLVQAAVHSGRIVTFICNEPAPFLLQQTSSLGFDLGPAVRSGQLVLLELDSRVASAVRTRGVRALVEAARAEEPISSTLVIDPFTALTTDLHDEASLRTAAREFQTAASPMDIVLTVESERLVLQNGLERALSEVCGAFLSLHRDESGRRRLVVEKTRSGVGISDRVEFSIGPGGARPLAAPPARDPLEADEEAPAPLEKARPLILVVDSDGEALDQISRWLSDRYDVALASDGFDAMTRLIDRRPDLVILDLLMPRITGYELLTAFRRAADSIPRLVISERMDRPGDRLGPLVLGATDVLAKPIERFELLHKIELLLRLPGPGPDHMESAEAEALFGTPSDSRVLDLEGWRARHDRACRFGERYGLTSSVAAISAPSSACLDRFIEAANVGLRFEDAVHRLDRRRALVLLVATEPSDAAGVIERLEKAVEPARGRPASLLERVWSASESQEESDWKSLAMAPRNQTRSVSR